MLKKLRDRPAEGADVWSVYIVRCGDGSFYTGIAKDVQSRVKAHNSGRGAAYTRSRRPVRLLYEERGLDRSGALVREARIKSYSRAEKECLVKRRCSLCS